MQPGLVINILRTILLGTISEEEINTKVCEALQTNAFFPNDWKADLISLPITSKSLNEALAVASWQDSDEIMNCSASTPAEVAFCDIAACFYTDTEAKYSLSIEKETLAIENQVCHTEERSITCLCPKLATTSFPFDMTTYVDFTSCANSSFSCDYLNTGECIAQGDLIKASQASGNIPIEDLVFYSEALRRFYDEARFPSALPETSSDCAAFHAKKNL